ncbi:MAG: zinc ribbon domain-containing protein [Eubacteriales bacterium]|nr:zinc ribbon domain-containing protein [Eubacteriales bacterium]
MELSQNNAYLRKILKSMRIAWCFTIVLAVILLSIGVSSLVTSTPFVELSRSGAIAMTAIGGICAFLTLILTVFGFIFPLVMKLAPKINRAMIEANKDNLQNIIDTVSKATKNSSVADEEKGTENESVFCRHCGQKIEKDSVFCKHCGEKQ